MMRWIRAAVVIAGMSVALPALGGELPLLIVAADFDALLGKAQPAPAPIKAPPTKIKSRSTSTEHASAPATVLPGEALAMRAPRAMK